MINYKLRIKNLGSATVFVAELFFANLSHGFTLINTDKDKKFNRTKAQRSQRKV